MVESKALIFETMKLEMLQYDSEEFKALMDTFEREYRDCFADHSMEREDKKGWNCATFYKNASVNTHFITFKRGYTLGKNNVFESINE